MLPAIAAALLAVAPARAGHLAGDVRFLDFGSKALEGTRTVAIYLPPGYETSGRRYPVLYAQDGQNVFEAGRSLSGAEWQLDETCERLIAAGAMAPVIVVAPYAGADRLGEYSMVPDPKYGGGRGEAYGRFLLAELKPAIDKTFRTLPDAAHTGLLGSSMGGLLSLELALAHPEAFGLAGALSPSIWWADRELLRRVAAAPETSARPRIWTDMGTREGDSPAQAVRDLRSLGAALQAKGWQAGRDLEVREIDGARHDENAWAVRVGDVLEFLFPPR